MGARHAMTSEGLFTVEGASRAFGLAESVIRNHIARGGLPVVRSHGRRVYIEPEIARAFAERYAKP